MNKCQFCKRPLIQKDFLGREYSIAFDNWCELCEEECVMVKE